MDRSTYHFVLDAKTVSEVLKNGTNTSLSLSDCTHVLTDISSGSKFLMFVIFVCRLSLLQHIMHETTSAANANMYAKIHT